ncbi:MAG: PD40 domain-containing protein [Candidatus Hydrogenedentes bacterium]|nr:PD40 domain-containing protein [Candidatus Hydrogenedentota bacterium]
MHKEKMLTGTARHAISRRTFLGTSASLLAASCASTPYHHGSKPFIGYTEYRTNLPTRHANQVTSRACIVHDDGTKRRELAPQLVETENCWTQFAGWSPDGTQAIIGCGWEDPENAKWEEENKNFRMTQGWKFDVYLFDMATGALKNMTEIERVSDYNSGLIYISGSPPKLGFTALINGISHPFVMDVDGRNKVDLSKGTKGFAYGFSASPDGKKVAYHQDYKIYVADADGENPHLIDTGNEFNFVPQWSPDGHWIMFVSGEHYNCHPYVARPDGSELRKLADRQGYSGVMTVYDIFDFHGGSSDVPVWCLDGNYVYYTAKVGEAFELMCVSLDGKVEQLTHSQPGVHHYHVKPAPDKQRIAFGSTRDGRRQLYVAKLDASDAHAITNVLKDSGAMWAHWQTP